MYSALRQIHSMFIYGAGPWVPSGLFQLLGCLLAGSEHLGIGGLPHVAGVSCKDVENCVYMAQGILECISMLYNHCMWLEEV